MSHNLIDFQSCFNYVQWYSPDSFLMSLIDNRNQGGSPVRPRKPAYHLIVYNGLEGLHTIRDHWQELTGRLKNKGFWHYYEWYESYLTALEKEPRKLFFFILADGRSIEAIIPLRLVRKKIMGIPANILELPKHPHMRLKDLIAVDHPLLDVRITFLLQQMRRLKYPAWDLIDMANILPNASAFKTFADGSTLCLIKDGGGCHYIEVDGSYEDFYKKKMSRNMRKNSKMWKNKASRIGRLHCKFIRELPELDGAFQLFMQMEASGWKGENGTQTAIRCDPVLINFYSHLIRKFGKMGACEIALLYLDEQPIAGTFSLVVGDTIYCMKIAYDEARAILSPGNLHMDQLLNNYFQDPRLKYFNLVSGASSRWHAKWPIASHATYRICLFNRNPKAICLYTLMFLKNRLRFLKSNTRDSIY